MRFFIGILYLSLCLLALISINVKANTFEKNGWEVITSNSEELVLSYSPQIIRFDTVKTFKGEITLYPRIAGAVEEMSSAGHPLKFLARQNITVPSPNGFQIDDIKIESIKHIYSLVTPVPLYKKK
ncbi:MAG: hypothetical protein ABSG15_09640 [FCB group bacterium]|jgi:hypothetical protein